MSIIFAIGNFATPPMIPDMTPVVAVKECRAKEEVTYGVKLPVTEY